jgi:Fur family ferric uptake transcriptional regulator
LHGKISKQDRKFKGADEFSVASLSFHTVCNLCAQIAVAQRGKCRYIVGVGKDQGRAMTNTILKRCETMGLRLTGQRRIIAQVIQDSDDHPDVEELFARAAALDNGISIATVYRTVKLFEEASILEKLEFGDGRARYEDAERDHHDHLIDMNSGKVIEFVDAEIEALQERIAKKLGYELRGHRLELYGVPLKPEPD